MGLVISITLAILGFTKPYGVHAGLYGLACNLITVWWFSGMKPFAGRAAMD